MNIFLVDDLDNRPEYCPPINKNMCAVLYDRWAQNITSKRRNNNNLFSSFDSPGSIDIRTNKAVFAVPHVGRAHGN